MSFRVIQVVQEFSRRGGVEHVVHELQQSWRAAGADAQVLTCVAEAASDVERILPMLAMVPTTGIWRYLGRLLAMPLFTMAASWRLRRRDAGTVVLSHGHSWVGDVCVIHAVNAASLASKREAGEWRWVLNPMHAWVAMHDWLTLRGLRFRRYVAVSRRTAWELQHYHRIPADRIAVIPNGVNLQRFTPSPDDGAATRAALGIRQDAPLLLFVGNEFDRKGLQHVLDAMPRLDPACRLLAVGGGDIPGYAAKAQALGIADRVIFTGPRSDLPQLYRAADAFVFPTAYETFSLVCMEAMACGLPIFASLTGGIEDYLQEGINGHAILRDGAGIAAVLAPKLADAAALRGLRAGALATAANYAWPAIAQRYQDLLREVWLEREAPGPVHGIMSTF